MNSDMGGDVIALDGGGTALVPTAGQVEVIRALASDVFIADMLLYSMSYASYASRVASPGSTYEKGLCGRAALAALVPLTRQVVVGGDGRARSLCSIGSGCFRLLLGRHLELWMWSRFGGGVRPIAGGRKKCRCSNASEEGGV